jgi:vancomycin resistance protein YoaR
MRTCLIVALAAASLVCAPALRAQDAPPASRPAATTQASQPVELGQYEAMKEVCKLTSHQDVKLAEKVAAMEQTMSAARQANDPKLRDLQKQLAQAAADNDKELAAKLLAQSRELRSKIARTRAACDADVLSILTDPQRLAWESFRTRRHVDGVLGRTQLSQDQAKRVQQLCDEAAKELVKLKGDDPPSRRIGILRQAAWKVYQEVLSASQRGRLDKPPDPSTPDEEEDPP